MQGWPFPSSSGPADTRRLLIGHARETRLSSHSLLILPPTSHLNSPTPHPRVPAWVLAAPRKQKPLRDASFLSSASGRTHQALGGFVSDRVQPIGWSQAGQDCAHSSSPEHLYLILTHPCLCLMTNHQEPFFCGSSLPLWSPSQYSSSLASPLLTYCWPPKTSGLQALSSKIRP